MGEKRLAYASLQRFCSEVFIRFGFSAENSAIITDVLLLADLFGIRSHGVQRLFRYHRGVRDGSMRVGPKPEVVYETPVSCVIDGHLAIGQVVGHFAMGRAIEKARRQGICLVSVRHSNHYGIAGYYAKMASDKGLVGISMTNSAAVVVPTFGQTAMLGTNPIAVAMPANPYPFLFDASTAVVARGKIEMYKKLGKAIPQGLAVDEAGEGSTDAAYVLACTLSRKGGILPLGGEGETHGGHKGYGLGIICELFSSIFALGVPSNHVSISGGDVSHGFIAIDPGIFGDANAIEAHFSSFLAELRAAPTVQGQRIYTHGEKEAEAYRERMQNGVPVDSNTLSEMTALARELGVDLPEDV